MEKENGQNGFELTYSAREQAELKRIRSKYTVREEDPLMQVRRLDRGVTQKAQVVSLIFGIVGTLILGFGMSLVLSELSVMLGLSGWWPVIIGAVCGIFGGVLIALAYPMYRLTEKKAGEKVAPLILRLTEELMQ